MIRKLLVLLVILLTLISVTGYGNYYPPAPPPGILYGNIIQSDPITVVDATSTLNFALNIHQWYLDHPEYMTALTGGADWHTQWVNAYDDIVDLINQLESNQGRTRTIFIVIMDEGVFSWEVEDEDYMWWQR